MPRNLTQQQQPVQPQAREEPKRIPIMVNRHQDADQVVMQARWNNYEGQNNRSLFSCLGSVLNLDLRKLRSYGPLVKTKGRCFWELGKTTVSFSWSSWSSAKGTRNACEELGHRIITWDFQIFSSAAVMSGSSIN